MDRSKKMLYGGIAAVVVLVLVVVVAWPHYSQNNQVNVCAPSADKPDVKAIQVKNLASEDEKVLANLAGYVELIGEKQNSYLTLDVDSVKSVTKGDLTTVSLLGECVNVDVTYKVVKDPKNPNQTEYQFDSIDMDVRQEKTKEAKSICDFDTPFTFRQPIDYYYTCTKTQSHQCSTKDDKDAKKIKPVANLVLVSFGMEFDRAKDAKKDEFVKKPWSSSCSVWEK